VTASLLLNLPVQMFVATQRTDLFSVQANPRRRLEASVLWVRGRQDLDRQLSNQLEQIEARMAYRFRKMRFEFGYAKYDMSFLVLTGYGRSRVYFRISRFFGIA
jgi:hypothetical protein